MHYSDYADAINLFEPFIVKSIQYHEDLVDSLIEDINSDFLNHSSMEKRQLLRAVLNTLPPKTLSTESIAKLDSLLQKELQDKTLVDLKEIRGKEVLKVGRAEVLLFQGDITTLKADAIVNAANNQLLGCFQPLHACIDNAIHSAAGVQLRDDCQTIMEKLGHLEETGQVKITRAYNLPSKFVIHTVGPIIGDGKPNAIQRQQLESCYRSTLDLCHEIDQIKSVAFCCISTGVFGYPQDEAASMAIDTVTHWLEAGKRELDSVVFNVFTDEDYEIYTNLLEELWKKEQ